MRMILTHFSTHILRSVLVFMSHEIEYRHIAFVGRQGIACGLSNGVVSEAHNAQHLRNVALLTQVIGNYFDFLPEEQKLAYVTGWFHDAVRKPTEDPSVSDEMVSAHAAVNFLQNAHKRNLTTVTRDQCTAVSWAIENHGQIPNWLMNEKTRNHSPRNLRDKLWLALFVADKIEANGARVIARRSSFVAGDRLHNSKGDWQTFGFQPYRDELVVVAVESILRLSLINPEEIYPDRLKPLVSPLYTLQRQFVTGVLAASGHTLETISNLLLTQRDNHGRTILEKRNLCDVKETRNLVELISARSGLREDSASDDLAQAARETVKYFATH